MYTVTDYRCQRDNLKTLHGATWAILLEHFLVNTRVIWCLGDLQRVQFVQQAHIFFTLRVLHRRHCVFDVNMGRNVHLLFAAIRAMRTFISRLLTALQCAVAIEGALQFVHFAARVARVREVFA